MQLDPKRLKKQEEALLFWKEAKGIGTIEAVTGFGKSYIGIMAINRMMAINPGRTTIIIVPSIALKTQWEQQVLINNLKNVLVYVVNSVALKDNILGAHLLIIDEIHRMASEKFVEIFNRINYKWILGLTATMERQDKRHYIIEKKCPIVYKVDYLEALNENFVSEFVVLNVPFELTEEESKKYYELDAAFYKYFSLFDKDLALVNQLRKNKGSLLAFSRRVGWDPKTVQIYIVQLYRTMQKRKQFLYRVSSRTSAALKLIDGIHTQIVTFSESISSVDQLTDACSKSASYHSKLSAKKREAILSEFKEKKIRVINTAKALDEGVDIPEVAVGIICSSSSTKRQTIQRTGRIIRRQDNKTALIINIFAIDTQDERWLRKRVTDMPNVIWTSGIEEALNIASAVIKL